MDTANEQRRQEKMKQKGHTDIEKHYEVPNNVLFRHMLYPHYYMEWNTGPQSSTRGH
ncbi:hypothetical protein MGN70_006961 [Eutypa lata]|nr:hypothetical protein MGN70_006961 [Eutypa lata]